MTKELQQFHFDDLCADLASEIERGGARHFLVEFHSRYPDHYQELKTQINRDHKQIPALLKSNGEVNGTC